MASKAKPAARAKPATRAKPAAKAKPTARPKPADKGKLASRTKPETRPRFRPAPRDKDLPPPKPMPVIPAELLDDAPKLKKPRKARGRKAEAKKPANALDLILAQLDDAKAEQIVSIPLDDRRAVADAVVVASGRSNRHVGAIADQLVQKLKEKGYRDLRVEGMPQCDWVLVDAGDVVVHIFRPEVRSFYNLEKLLSASAPDDRAVM
jgi:ribosome-associated protein